MYIDATVAKVGRPVLEAIKTEEELCWEDREIASRGAALAAATSAPADQLSVSDVTIGRACAMCTWYSTANTELWRQTALLRDHQ